MINKRQFFFAVMFLGLTLNPYKQMISDWLLLVMACAEVTSLLLFYYYTFKYKGE